METHLDPVSQWRQLSGSDTKYRDIADGNVSSTIDLRPTVFVGNQVPRYSGLKRAYMNCAPTTHPQLETKYRDIADWNYSVGVLAAAGAVGLETKYRDIADSK